jgi:hypothetical protein
VFWDAGVDHAIIFLKTADDPLPYADAIVRPKIGINAVRTSADGLYAVCGHRRFRMPVVLLAGSSPEGPLDIVIPLTADTQGRLNAAIRFLSLKRGRAIADSRITPQRRHRFQKLLRTFDARTRGASHREIAAALFGSHRISAPDWHESSLRYATLRSVQDGLALVRGGYRDILRHRSKA